MMSLVSKLAVNALSASEWAGLAELSLAAAIREVCLDVLRPGGFKELLGAGEPPCMEFLGSLGLSQLGPEGTRDGLTPSMALRPIPPSEGDWTPAA